MHHVALRWNSRNTSAVPSLSPGMAFGADGFKPALFVFLWV